MNSPPATGPPGAAATPDHTLRAVNEALLVASVRQHELADRALRAEADARENEKRYRTLFNSIDEGFCIIEMIFDRLGQPTDYVFLEVNEAFERQCGLHDAVGKRVRELSPDIEEHWFQTYGSVATTGESLRFSAHSPALDRCFDLYAFRVGGDESHRVAVLFTDVSDRIRLETALNASEVRYRRLFQSAKDGLLILRGADGRVIDANAVITTLLDRSLPEILGRTLWEIGFYENEAQWSKDSKRLQVEGFVRKDDVVLATPSGVIHHVELVSSLYLEDREPTIQCNVRDITERQRLNAERDLLIESERAAHLTCTAANLAKDVFLATLSHELRTPLNAMLGWAVILRSPKTGPADLAVGLEIIERNARTQSRLIEDVLDVARIVSGKVALDFKPCDFALLIHAAVDMVRLGALAKGLSLVVTDAAGPTPPARWVAGDAVRLQQVIVNLLSNAVKFTPKGGRICVDINSEGVNAIVTITDTGKGIRAEFLPFIFDRFKQADEGTTRVYGGLGLGLSIVHHLVELHGGTVTAASEGDGCGSTFVLTLPLQADARAAFVPVAEPDAPCLEHLHVLVIDDEPDTLTLVAKVLRLAGAIVHLASSPAEGFRLATNPSLHLDLLVCDIAMPGEDGCALLGRIRAHGLDSRRLPALAHSALASVQEKRRTLVAGFQAHLAKPADPRDLVKAVAGLAHRASA